MGLKPSSTSNEMKCSRAHPLLLIEPSAKPILFKEPPHPFTIEKNHLEESVELDTVPYIQNKHDFLQNYLERFEDGYFVFCEDCAQE